MSKQGIKPSIPSLQNKCRHSHERLDLVYLCVLPSGPIAR